MPEAEVIMISQNDPALVVRQAREVNARGYVAKSELAHSHVPMIRRLEGKNRRHSHSASFL
jgi:DNA-binding NarL/FixJ family response regulator